MRDARPLQPTQTAERSMSSQLMSVQGAICREVRDVRVDDGLSAHERRHLVAEEHLADCGLGVRVAQAVAAGALALVAALAAGCGLMPAGQLRRIIRRLGVRFQWWELVIRLDRQQGVHALIILRTVQIHPHRFPVERK